MREGAELLCDYACACGLWSEWKTQFEFFFDGFDDEWRLMTEQLHTKAHRYVQVLITVDVPQTTTGCARSNNRVEHLLGREPKPRGAATIREHGTELLSDALGATCVLDVLRDEVFQVSVLSCAEVGDWLRVDFLERHK